MVLQECEQEIPVSYMERQTLFQKLKGDLLIVGIILLLAATFFLINVIRDRESSGEGSVLLIRDGSVTASFPLSEDITVTLWNEERTHYNLLMIRDGSAEISDANCPDKICVRSKAIARDGESIICLPHRLVLSVHSERESDMDAGTG